MNDTTMALEHFEEIKLGMSEHHKRNKTQGKIDLRNESGRPMKVKVVGEVSEK